MFFCSILNLSIVSSWLEGMHDAPQICEFVLLNRLNTIHSQRNMIKSSNSIRGNMLIAG